MSHRGEFGGLPVKQQITFIYDLAASALSRANEWSGWGGKSVKDHVEDAESLASSALTTAQENSDAIEELRDRVDTLERVRQ